MKLRLSEFWLSIILITVVSALAFLPFAMHLGFYFNDWHPLSGETAGVSSYFLFKLERPGVGYLYDLIYPILGPNPLAWQLFTFALRLGGVICFFLILRRMWPGCKLETTLASLLMAIYPGFMQQPIALTFSNHFITLGTALLSIYFTVLALQSGKRWQQVLITLLALILELCYLFVYEYMLGLEVLRLLLMGLIIYRRSIRKFSQLAGRTLLVYLPYLIPLAGFLIWRLTFVSSRPTTDLRVLGAAYQSDWLGMAGRLVMETLRDAFETGFLAWAVPLYQSISQAAGWLIAFSVGLGLLAGGLVWLVTRQRKSENLVVDFSAEWIWIGGISLLAAVFPVVLSNREVRFENLLDRYTLHAAGSVALLVSGLIFRFFRPGIHKWVHILLIVSAVAAMVGNAYPYVQRWQVQRQTWWQLTWRAPQLKPDTVLVAFLPSGLRLMEGSEIWTPANWIYYPSQRSLYLTGEVLDEVSLRNIQTQSDTPRNFRNILFTNKFDQMLLLSMSSLDTCLHVVDGKQIESAGGEDMLTLQAAPYSLIGQVMTNKELVTPPTLFGPEPIHGWCYYYQKASLARQQLNWAEVVRLGDEASQLGLAPNDLSEWLPFIEGTLNLGQAAQAEKLIGLIRAESDVQFAICLNIQANRSTPGSYSDADTFASLTAALCAP